MFNQESDGKGGVRLRNSWGHAQEWLDVPASRINDIDSSYKIHIKELVKHNMGADDEVLCKNYRWVGDLNNYDDDRVDDGNNYDYDDGNNYDDGDGDNYDYDDGNNYDYDDGDNYNYDDGNNYDYDDGNNYDYDDGNNYDYDDGNYFDNDDWNNFNFDDWNNFDFDEGDFDW